MDQLKIKLVKRTNSIKTPLKHTQHSSGVDLCADIETDLTIEPFKIALIPTGIFLEIPEGFEGQVRPRSGLSLKYGITVLNTPGTIDADYRGEVKVILINFNDISYTIKKGDRIAQLVFSKVYSPVFEEVESLCITERNEKGFGSSDGK